MAVSFAPRLKWWLWNGTAITDDKGRGFSLPITLLQSKFHRREACKLKSVFGSQGYSAMAGLGLQACVWKLAGIWCCVQMDRGVLWNLCQHAPVMHLKFSVKQVCFWSQRRPWTQNQNCHARMFSLVEMFTFNSHLDMHHIDLKALFIQISWVLSF